MRMQLAALFVCAPALVWSADWKPADSPLTTPWTGKVTAEHALPEYPRPQMVRAKWTNLNGLWDYAIRPKDEKTARAVRGQTAGALRGGIGALRSEAPAHAGTAALVPPHLHGRSPRRARECCCTSAPSTGAPRSSSTAKRWDTHEGGYDPFTFDITDALQARRDAAGTRRRRLGSHRHRAAAARQTGAQSQRHLVHRGNRHLADRVAGACAGGAHPASLQ